VSNMNKKLRLGFSAVIVLALLLSHSKPSTNAGSPIVSPSLGLPPRDSVLDGSSAPPQKQDAFDGDPCISDCSGHQAGYNWAESHGIDDEDDCDTAGENSNSPSFAEGCKAYVRGDGPDESSSDEDSNN
jgi:hypothetical protein